MADVVIVSFADVRVAVFDAISEQWNRDIAEHTERSPEGHQNALTDAVMAAIPSGVDVHIHG